MRNTFEIHEKYIWTTIKRASDGNIQITILILRWGHCHHQLFPIVFIIVVSIIIFRIIIFSIVIFSIIITVVIEHPHHCDWIWEKPAALKATAGGQRGWRSGEDGRAQTATWANIVFLFCNSAQKLRRHDCLHWHRRQWKADHSWTTTCFSPQAARGARYSRFQTCRRDCLHGTKSTTRHQ